MAVKLILAVGLVVLAAGGAGATEVFADNALPSADLAEQTKNSIADEGNEVERLVETLKTLVEEGRAMTDEDSSVDGLDGNLAEEDIEEYEEKEEQETRAEEALEEVRDVVSALVEEDIPDEDSSVNELDADAAGGETGEYDDEEEEELETRAEEALEEVRHVVSGLPRTVRVCEHRTLTIRCSSGQRINIASAQYGRTSRNYCPHSSIRTTSCRASSSLSRVRTSCQGKSSCSVSASNGVFGDPCVHTFKYLEVRYTCTGRPTGCAGWTRWYDRDNPSATGDWEVLSHLRSENPGQICARPSGIQARVKGSNQPASQTGQRFRSFTPQVGFSCVNSDQGANRSCRDYEVRFWCP